MDELLNYTKELGGVAQELERDVWRCSDCGQLTNDWWYVNKKTGECHCRSCYSTNKSASQSSGEGAAPCGDTSRLDVRKEVKAKQKEQTEDTLSTFHISPKIEYRAGASKFTVKGLMPKMKLTQLQQYPRERRGKVAGFSAKSRNRLMRTLGEVRRDCLPVFVTLTFPAEYPTIERAKRDLDTFIKRLARKFPDVAGVWKLEPQKRGAPHFHLLVWGVSYLDLLEFVPVAWCEVVASDDENHLAWHKGELGNKPCVQQIEKQQGVFWYASKYMSKQVTIDCVDWGRWWGVFFRNKLPLGELVNVEITEKKAFEIIRYMRRYARIKPRNNPSLTIICDADFWINRLL